MVRFTQAWSRFAALSLRAKLLTMVAVWLVFTGVFSVVCVNIATAPLEQDEQRTQAALTCSETKRAFVNLDADLVTEVADVKQRQQESEKARLAQAAQPSGQPPAPVEIQVPRQNGQPPFETGEQGLEPQQQAAPVTPAFVYHHSDPGYDRPGVKGTTTDSAMIRSYLDLVHQAQVACGPWVPDAHATQWGGVMMAGVDDATIAAFKQDVMQFMISY